MMLASDMEGQVVVVSEEREMKGQSVAVFGKRNRWAEL